MVLFNLADNATTFLCLRAPVPGFEVVEANPAARLAVRRGRAARRASLLEMVVTTAAIAFLVATDHASRRASSSRCCVVLAALPAWAALNNWLVIQATNLPIAWS